MTDSCNGDPSHADTILCLESPTLALVTRCGPRYNEGGKEPPSRSRFYRHASPLALGRGPVPLPFCLPPLIVPIFFPLFSFFFFIIPSSSSSSSSFFLRLRTTVNGFSRADFRGRLVAAIDCAARGRENVRVILSVCVALCHFFIHF